MTPRRRKQADSRDEPTPLQVMADVQAIRQDRKLKMSEVTLRYLKEKRIIGSDKVGYYLCVDPDPQERKTISEKGIIELVNNKLLDAYSTTTILN